jgi:hypothetical protein
MGKKGILIHLTEEDRASLERLRDRQMKPTRRQKAIALLLLADGRTASDAAIHAGISKERVEALAKKFAESGLAGVGFAGKSRNQVRLVRPGVGIERYYLDEAETLEDLLRLSTVDRASRAVYIDGELAEKSTPLRDGAVVMIVPQLENAAAQEPWRAPIPSFQDEALFGEYLETLKARRQEPGADEDPAL